MRRALVAFSAVALAALAALALSGSLGTRNAAVPSRRAVEDPSGLLGPYGSIVEKQCRALATDLGIDVRVAVVHGAGEDIAALAERLFRTLGVGRGAASGGILVLIDRQNGRARIEVSYSLEGSFPDAFVSRLVRDQLVPYASHRAAGMAVMDVVHFLRARALDAAAAGELALAPARAVALADELAQRSGGAGAEALLPAAPSHAEFKRRVPEPRRARYAPSADPRESVAALARVQADLAGDATLELFTAASRVMRERSPVAPYEEALRARALRRAEPLELRIDGDHAVAAAPRAAVREFVPILLAREDGLWRVDLVETYKLFRFDREGHYRLITSATPYAKLFPEERPPDDASLAPLDLAGEPVAAAIARLERSVAPDDRFALAEILMRNCFLSAEAIVLYAELASADPPSERHIVAFAERAANLGMPEAALAAVARLGLAHASRLAWLYERAGERDLAREHYRRALARSPRDGFSRAALQRLGDAPR
jgi:uncharacterized protein